MSDDPTPPQALRTLVSWQAGRLATIGARLTSARMPLEARSDFAVLAALDENGALSQAEIGRALGLDRNNVNGIVVRLEGDEAVTREPDPTDRRRNVVTITAAGRVRLAEIQVLADAVQDELLAALSTKERKDLIHLLDRALSVHGVQSA
ncbi:MarR family transcriptional regulator [Curtobacterium flaccumfaciens pv. flaccumfaciens]|uniref:MarR family winged helix-turn-helix transcriptional regulator n=1 Tax=Curtobacterium flaccumfaciens TaxID=2035 RepID=UPI001ADA3827|nr:MarR family transcriptional regulator [Curtobacterium flaccumfaciens]MBO9048180.1 MarR family transcriptional regulator [Curtobacterium flaccumfaciens pv. flaccumfaciens]MBO9058107.1 MarR family transcriptional regulator [Curtobacterium flaccumfaciens pv. flaccumfaciens]QTR90247.1 MarR family transcriptional regulator [Curtobacterium flaccumfaciens pv. flaccumfaciens]QVG65520.1 MarR family transcriptional regulator [Curtobacterium flaccumfaciens pv. flaccumfaciens]